MKKLTSPRQLERRLRLHLAAAFCAGCSSTCFLFMMGTDLEKGRGGPLDLLYLLFFIGSAWGVWANGREDLRQLTHMAIDNDTGETFLDELRPTQ